MWGGRRKVLDISPKGNKNGFCFSLGNKEEFHENSKELGGGGKRLLWKTSVDISF